MHVAEINQLGRNCNEHQNGWYIELASLNLPSIVSNFLYANSLDRTLSLRLLVGFIKSYQMA